MYSPPHPFRWDSRLPGRANISNRFLCWVNALIVTLVILIGILIMYEATVGILAGIKDVLGIRPRTPRIICCPGHLKETENYVRLALHFKGESVREPDSWSIEGVLCQAGYCVLKWSFSLHSKTMPRREILTSSQQLHWLGRSYKGY